LPPDLGAIVGWHLQDAEMGVIPLGERLRVTSPEEYAADTRDPDHANLHSISRASSPGGVLASLMKLIWLGARISSI
jgi:hypothetical protein